MIINLDPKRIKISDERRWKEELYNFLKSLSETEFELAQKIVNVMNSRPAKRTEPCEVIQLVKEV